jgi:hypothetical protein
MTHEFVHKTINDRAYYYICEKCGMISFKASDGIFYISSYNYINVSLTERANKLTCGEYLSMAIL